MISLQNLETRGYSKLSVTLILFFGPIALLLLALGWTLWKPREGKNLQTDPRWLEERGQRHTTYLPQIRQALAPADYNYLSQRTPRRVQRRVRRHRVASALAYQATSPVG